MAHYTRYSGEFLSRAGVAWKVDIWQEAPLPFAEVEELTFPADEPVVIEWDSKAKEEVICGSACTVKIESPSDRKYIDLYAVTPGEIGVKIYRKARGASDYSLYWMGALDAEQYEEPYERAWGYDVMLTFQDFGAWGRLRYNLEGMQNMAEVLIDACQRVGLGDMVHTDETTLLDYSSFVSSMHIDETPTGGNDPEYPDSDIADDFTPSDQEGRIRPIYHYVPEGSEEVNMNDATVGPAWLETMAVQSAAFYDDGGEGMTLDEVITAMLQPLAMRIVQRNGRLWVYDINALAVIEMPIPTPIDWQEPPGFPKPITWTGDSQTLSTDAVYNKVKVTFDPKADGTLLDKDVEVEGADDLSVNTREDASSHVVEPYTYTFYSSYEEEPYGHPIDPTDLNFSIIFSTKGSGLEHIKNFYYKIVGLLGGSDASGVMGFFMDGHFSYNDQRHSHYREGGMPQADTVLMRTERVYIPPIARRLASDKRYMLRIQLDILADPRYNPFEEKGSYNEEYNYGDTEACCGYAMAPCSLKLWDSKTGGTVKWHYDNRPVASRLELGSDTRISLSQALGSWSSEYGSGVNDDSTAHACCWLSWYDNSAKEDRENTQAIIGWHTNHQTIGLVNGHLRSDISELPAGQYIPYPPDGGWLELTVWDGLAIIDSPDNMSDAVSPYPIANLASRAVGTTFGREWNVLQHLRWLLYKAPKIDVVWGKGGHDVVSIDEIVTERDALTGAENDLEIDLACGTVGKDLPSARGQIYRIATFLPLRQLTRCGVTDTPERLLARTLCAQYGRRQTMLSGEAALTADDPHLWTDANRPGKKMLLLGEVQNLIEDTTDVELCDVVPDSRADEVEVSMYLYHCTSNAPEYAVAGSPLQIAIALDTGYASITNVSVVMAGINITQSAYNPATGIIRIASVTGAVVITATGSTVITFEDAAVKAICVNNWGGNVVAGEITVAEAAAVKLTGSDQPFQGNTNIRYFDELQYFTNITSIAAGTFTNGKFYNCTNLERVTLPKCPIKNLVGAFRACKSLVELDITPLKTNDMIIRGLCYMGTGATGAALAKVKIPGTTYDLNFESFVRGASNLTTIEIDGTADFSGLANFTNAFSNCVSLTTITGTITGIKVNISLSASPLTRASTLVIINGLYDFIGAGSSTRRTLTLSATAKARLTTDDIALAEAKGWTIA